MSDLAFLLIPYDYNTMLRQIEHANIVAIDTETTGLRPYSVDDIRGLSLATEFNGTVTGWYVPITHPDSRNYDPGPILRALKGKSLIFHHATFDWAFLDQLGGDGPDWPADTLWDTQVCNWLLDENLKVGLKESCERIFGTESGDEKRHLAKIRRETGRDWPTFTAEDIGVYAAMDAVLTYKLFRWQCQYGLPESNPSVTSSTMIRHMRTERNLYRLRKTGIKVDPEKINDGEWAFMQRVEQIKSTFRGMNPNSPKQVAKWLEDHGAELTVRTATGAPSVNKNVLQALANGGNSAAKVLLEYRHLTKAITGYFRPLHKEVGEDGRIHPSFSSTRTVTGRFSCSAPNLQTIPRDDTMPEVRACFVPEDGYRLVGFDLKQAELRVIAGYAGETSMIEALEQGRDLHSETAESIFGPDFTPLQRRLAKNLNFGFAYGIGPAKFATYINPVPTAEDVQQAGMILRGYKATYPKVAQLLDGMEKIAKRDGSIPGYPEGRYRRFKGPGYHKLPAARKPQTYTAVNFIVQGGIGEFMKDVMDEWYSSGMDQDWRHLVLQVHDELVFEVEAGHGFEVRVAFIQDHLQGIADALKPFPMRMEWDRKDWSK